MKTNTKLMIGGGVVVALGAYYLLVLRPKTMASAVTSASQALANAPPQSVQSTPGQQPPPQSFQVPTTSMGRGNLMMVNPNVSPGWMGTSP